MGQEKIKIVSDIKGPPYWRPLLPIVEFCLDRGSKLDGMTAENPFFEDRNGSNECRIYGPVTVKELLNKFNLPEHFEVSETYVSDEKNRSVIFFRSFEDFEEVLEKRRNRKQKRKELQERIRIRKKEQNLNS